MTHSAENLNMTLTHETETKPKTFYLGTLKDFGLGNPEGIPSSLAEATDAERMEYVDKLVKTVTDVTDLVHFSCIDGRECLCNADGSETEERRHQTGGGATVEVAMYSGAALLGTIEGDGTVADVVNRVESELEDATGVKRSAHLGGCGSAGGAIPDAEAVAGNPAIMNATEAVMSHPDVVGFTNLPYSSKAGEAVREGAGKTAEWLKAGGWDGAKYVEGVKKDEPAGVEDLVAAHDKFHGHEEPATVLVISRSGTKTLSKKKMKEMGVKPPFIVNLDASLEEAEFLGGPAGKEGVTRAFTANVAKHLAVGSRLTHVDSPVFLMVID